MSSQVVSASLFAAAYLVKIHVELIEVDLLELIEVDVLKLVEVNVLELMGLSALV